MGLVEVGRVCVKKFGRDAGKRAVVTKVIDANFVHIMTSVRLKERKCNVKHLEFLSEKVDPKSKEQVAKALEVEAAKVKV
ncbi:MAG: 50S ribosomal protein L14e [Candidatus Marsarchaeota archaeon]|nr:50S ribosomal protein L14e [Candidatus Marsarchaeota archaeon]